MLKIRLNKQDRLILMQLIIILLIMKNNIINKVKNFSEDICYIVLLTSLVLTVLVQC